MREPTIRLAELGLGPSRDDLAMRPPSRESLLCRELYRRLGVLQGERCLVAELVDPSRGKHGIGEAKRMPWRYRIRHAQCLRSSGDGLVRISQQPQPQRPKAKGGDRRISADAVAQRAIALTVVNANRAFHVRAALAQVAGPKQRETEELVATHKELGFLSALGQAQKLLADVPRHPQFAPVD